MICHDESKIVTWSSERVSDNLLCFVKWKSFFIILLTFHPLWKLNHKLQICRISTWLLIYELLRVFSNSLSFLFSMVVFRESLWITWKFGSISKSLSEKECRNSYFEACGYIRYALMINSSRLCCVVDVLKELDILP